MVTQLMRAENMRMDRITRRRQLAVWRQEDLRNTVHMLNDFRSAQTAINTPNTMMNTSVWNTMRTQITNVTNPGGSTAGITVTAVNDANVGNVNVRVSQIASGDAFRGNEVFQSHANPNATPLNLNSSLLLFLVRQSRL
jgi:flagellar capping protein FliD